MILCLRKMQGSSEKCLYNKVGRCSDRFIAMLRLLYFIENDYEKKRCGYEKQNEIQYCDSLMHLFTHPKCSVFYVVCILFSHCLNIAVWRKRVANCYLLQYIFRTFATRTRYFGFIPTR